MAVFISGSVAYDTIFRFDGIFADHLQGDLRKLNLTFQSSQMRRQFGGCAGNIAYALKSLGGDPLIVTTVGQDADPYLEHFKACGIRTEGILKVQDDFTAQRTGWAINCALSTKERWLWPPKRLARGTLV